MLLLLVRAWDPNHGSKTSLHLPDKNEGWLNANGKKKDNLQVSFIMLRESLCMYQDIVKAEKRTVFLTLLWIILTVLEFFFPPSTPPSTRLDNSSETCEKFLVFFFLLIIIITSDLWSRSLHMNHPPPTQLLLSSISLNWGFQPAGENSWQHEDILPSKWYYSNLFFKERLSIQFIFTAPSHNRSCFRALQKHSHT